MRLCPNAATLLLYTRTFTFSTDLWRFPPIPPRLAKRRDSFLKNNEYLVYLFVLLESNVTCNFLMGILFGRLNYIRKSEIMTNFHNLGRKMFAVVWNVRRPTFVAFHFFFFF